MPAQCGSPGKSSLKGDLSVIGGVLSGRETGADLRARLKEYRGDSHVSRALQGLPRGWHSFHDLNLGDESVDNVATGPRGVFTIEVSVDAGTVVANSRGLFTHGRRNTRLIDQAMRRARTLETHLGVAVQPALVVVGADLTGNEVDGLPVVLLEELKKFLLRDDGRPLSWDEAKRVLDALEETTR